ncbi:DNA mismatch repair protein [Pseudocyphellaria aurata]|nr:DNA mismatch repair protein [Pseudocyphellaria aurata]
MLGGAGQILPLSAETVAQIKSSTAITSLSSVVIGLVENSLDAGARKIEISVDFRRGHCTVEDDGCGIPPLEFSENGGLGRPHHTSKNGRSSIIHGGEGTFVSSLAALSILTITSHHQAYNSHASLILHHSRPAARLLPAPSYHHLSNREHGTRVTVQDLFGNMPVRVKQRNISYTSREHEKQWEMLRKQIVGMLLAWNASVMLILSSPESTKKLCIRAREGFPVSSTAEVSSTESFDLSLIRSILSQALYIEPSEFSEWVETSIRTSSISIQGAISSQPAPSKQVQFLSLGIQYLNPEANAIFYDQINHLFATSSFGKQEEILVIQEAQKKNGKKYKKEQSVCTSNQVKGAGKGVDRWPMFFIRIDMQSEPKMCSKSGLEQLEMESTLSSISNTLEAMIIGYLNDNHLRPRMKRVRRAECTENESALGLKPHDLRHQKTFCEGSQTGTLQCSHSSNRFFAISESNIDANAIQPVRAERCVRQDAALKSTTFADTLSSSVKLPSFPRRNSFPYDGFCSWSRIKSGRREHLQEMNLQKPVTGEQQQLRNSQGKDTCQAVTTTTENHVGDMLTRPNDGIMTRTVPCGMATNKIMEPLLDQTSQETTVEDETTSKVESSQRTDLDRSDFAEETITWFNPVSRASILINARTGQVAPRTSGKNSNSRSEAHFSDASSMNTNLKRVTRNASVPFGTSKTGSWTSEFLKTWNNPVFCLSEENISQLSLDSPGNETASILQGGNERCSDIDIQKAFTNASSMMSKKLSKESLGSAKVIAQVDKKFILINVTTTPKGQSQASSWSIPQKLLVLVDQHAADERIRIESLLADLCSPPLSGENVVPDCIHPTSHVTTTVLVKPVVFDIQAQERDLFTKYASFFASWGVLYTLSISRTESSSLRSHGGRLVIKALPEGIAERCRADIKVLAEFMRGEVWKREECGLKVMEHSEGSTTTSVEARSNGIPSEDPIRHHWLHRMGDCPRGILDMLNSRSCRSAIMFNDGLTIEECEVLIKRLALCAFPFQCAHGRPSMIPLVQFESSSLSLVDEITAFGTRQKSTNREAEKEFGHAWKTWQKVESNNAEMDGVEEALS